MREEDNENIKLSSQRINKKNVIKDFLADF